MHFLNSKIDKAELSKLYDEALKDTIHRFEETGSPVITDGEQQSQALQHTQSWE